MREFSPWLRDFALRSWEARREFLDRLDYPALPDEALLARYLLGTLPLTDLGDCPPEDMLGFARHGLRLWKESPLCADLPEELFLQYVLCPRVNNEALSPCREPFYQALSQRIQGLSLPEAILEVNRWCAERVVYRSTDGRTASALELHRSGWGRCGEESVYAVNAMRSVGIAARQVYAPWWSHCDDNHAWVEAFDGESWRFLGGCEPEPRLDVGWFAPAAGRAMLCHTKSFVGGAPGWEKLFPGVSPLDLDLREGVAYLSVTDRYAKVNSFTVRTEDGKGNPLSGVAVDFCVFNEGQLRRLAGRKTGPDGKTALNLGLGDLWLVARQGDQIAEALVSTAETGHVELILTSYAEKQESFTFSPPADSGIKWKPLTPQEKRQRREAREQAKRLHESRSFPPEPPLPQELLPLLDCLTEKDRAGIVPREALEDSRTALSQGTSLPDEALRALISPRLDREPLAPWRRLLADVLPEVPPERLWPYLKENFSPAESFSELPQTPAGAWRLGAANGLGLSALAAAILRSRGVPARISPDGVPELWQDGRFRRADGRGFGTLTLRVREGKGCLGLMRWQDGWVSWPAPEADKAIPLPEGRYRLISSVRLPTGVQLCDFTDFALSPGEALEREISFRRGSPQEYLQSLPLPETGFSWTGTALLCWVEPGAEPTEHLINELKAVRNPGWQVHFSGEELGGLPLPEGVIRHEWDDYAAETVARRVFLEPGRLPLVVLADGKGFARFANAGYNVGLVELAASLVSELERI